MRAYIKHSGSNQTAVLSELSVGRTDADLCFQDEKISRKHAKFLVIKNIFFIIDLNSSNGTYINGKRIIPQMTVQLYDGDEVQIGHENISIKIDGDSHALPPTKELKADTQTGDNIIEIESSFAHREKDGFLEQTQSSSKVRLHIVKNPIKNSHQASQQIKKNLNVLVSEETVIQQIPPSTQKSKKPFLLVILFIIVALIALLFLYTN